MLQRFREKYTLRFALALWFAGVFPLSCCWILLLIFGTPPPNYDPVNALLTLFIFAVAFTIFVFPIALVLGAALGHLTARGLVPRIKALLSAADAWSAGSFDMVVQDASADELGQLTRRLNQMAARLQELVDVRQQVAILEERSRLAREFHDTVKQQLFATSMQLATARSIVPQELPMVEQCLTLAEDSLHHAQRALKETIAALRPAELEHGDLPSAIHQHTISWSEQYNIAVQIQCDNRSFATMPQEKEMAVYRVMQEALANVARHSGATLVTICLKQDPQAVALTIADNGIGFDLGALPEESMGLTNMRARIEALQGTFDIQSHPHQGTTVTARI
ncbi:MAG: sensor histidine kinase [Roseiflexaceae bacterium]|nr:sensor histidine kinase [Roseiflexaceae bacterium]